MYVIISIICLAILLSLFIYNKRTNRLPTNMQMLVVILITTITILAIYILMILVTSNYEPSIMIAIPPVEQTGDTTLFGSDFIVDIINFININLVIINIFCLVKTLKNPSI